MCKIIDDYAHELADERAAEVLVKNVETLAERDRFKFCVNYKS